MAKSKRGLVISDLHSGHFLGLMPSRYDFETQFNQELFKLRQYSRRWVYRTAKKYGPYDFMIMNGDCIDGRGEKSGGTELFTTDRLVQCKMAIDVINKFDVPKVFMSYGTGYHAGLLEDYENIIADGVGAKKIGGEDNLSVNGCIINYRHHIGRSAIPHGRHTAIARERLWNLIWAERDEYPKANIILRSHVHYHVGDFGPGWLAMITPGLQLYGGKYGSRLVSGDIHFGITILDIKSKDDFSWHVPILKMPKQEPALLR